MVWAGLGRDHYLSYRIDLDCGTIWDEQDRANLDNYSCIYPAFTACCDKLDSKTSISARLSHLPSNCAQLLVDLQALREKAASFEEFFGPLKLITNNLLIVFKREAAVER